MPRDEKQPLHFDLPDNDSVDLIPWAFVVDKCETILAGVIDSISSMEADVTRIDNKVKEWLEQNN